MTPQNSTSAQRYGTLDTKLQAKTALQQELGWPEEPKRAMVCIPTGITDALGGKLLSEVMPGLLTLPAQFLILGKGSATYGKMLTELAQSAAHRIALIPNSREEIAAMVGASDIALFLCDATSLPELSACLAAGTVPVAPHTNMLDTYNPNQESGCAFLYEKQTPWYCFASLVRALETYRFPYDWKNIQRACIDQVAR